MTLVLERRQQSVWTLWALRSLQLCWSWQETEPESCREPARLISRCSRWISLSRSRCSRRCWTPRQSWASEVKDLWFECKFLNISETKKGKFVNSCYSFRALLMHEERLCDQRLHENMKSLVFVWKKTSHNSQLQRGCFYQKLVKLMKCPWIDCSMNGLTALTAKMHLWQKVETLSKSLLHNLLMLLTLRRRERQRRIVLQFIFSHLNIMIEMKKRTVWLVTTD